MDPDNLLAENFAIVQAWFNDPANQAHINAITKLDLSNSGLTVLPDELRLFTNLTQLNLRWNSLTTVEISNLPASNQLTTVNISNLTALTHLDLEGNRLIEIDLSNLPALTFLDLRNNLLTTTVEISNLPVLNDLLLEGNPISATNHSILARVFSIISATREDLPLFSI